MNLVLFLGAGYSAAYNLPIMNDFLSFADSSTKLVKEEKDFIDQLVLESRRANSFLQSSPTNLEDILSFSVMADRLSLNNNKTESRNYMMRKILQKIFTQVSDPRDYWRKFDRFRSFLTFDPKEKKHNLSIITTNYDLCIECSLHKLGLKTDPCFPFGHVHDNKLIINRDNFYSHEGIPVLKLHGSVNWFENNEPSDFFNVDGRVVEIHGNFENEGIPKTLPYVCAGDYNTKIPPVIIPPSFLKPDLKGPLGQIWKIAADKLQSANLLVFVGYSFPMTDTEMLYFLARSLTDNPGLRMILLVDPFANDIVKKIHSQESKFGSHFKNLLKTEQDYWENTNLKKYL